MAALTDRTISAKILALLSERKEMATICPSEVARALWPQANERWRKEMPRIRSVAQTLVEAKRIVALQKGLVVSPVEAKGPIRLRLVPNLRNNPELYRVGRGEQGVLSFEPYKSEILPFWKFKTPLDAKKSATKIFSLFKRYRAKKDFVGMDMARKFLQMGFTRSRRYANHASGKKYGPDGTLLPREENSAKAESAEIFKSKWMQVERDPSYKAQKSVWRRTYG